MNNSEKKHNLQIRLQKQNRRLHHPFTSESDKVFILKNIEKIKQKLRDLR
jgi:hypothetical protein